MKYYKIVLATSAVLLSSVANATSMVNLLNNPGFEISESTFTGSNLAFLPSTAGDWAGDKSTIVTGTQTNGISPASGTGMLQFIFSGAVAPSESFGSSEVYQLVDLSSFSDSILTGTAFASASMFANRVAGDAETDSKFSIDIIAYDGVLSDFQSRIGERLGGQAGFLFTDDDISTWEEVSADLLLPQGTTYIALRVTASENIFNDAIDEFDGHYIDNVSFSVTTVPIPAAVWLFSSGLLGLVSIAKRKKS